MRKRLETCMRSLCQQGTTACGRGPQWPTFGDSACNLLYDNDGKMWNYMNWASGINALLHWPVKFKFKWRF